MEKKKRHSPLLGYNTNVRHSGLRFHIQTEDSGAEHPHITTHLFSEGIILATKKTSYEHLLKDEDIDADVRQLMKEQHKAMFIELRDGLHDQRADQLLGPSAKRSNSSLPAGDPIFTDEDKSGEQTRGENAANQNLSAAVPKIAPVKQTNTREKNAAVAPKNVDAGQRSIFDTPAKNGESVDSLITDKSLDEVILSYLTDELEE